MVPNPKELAANIKQLSADVGALSSKVYETLSPSAEDSKRVPLYISQPVSFAANDMTLKETSFVNNAEDLSIVAMTYAVTTSLPPGVTVPDSAVAYLDAVYVTNSAIFIGHYSEGITGFGVFDFDWNFRTKIGTTYLGAGAISGGASMMLPRTMLGFYEQGNILRFDRPQVLKAGESLVFSAKPTLWYNRYMDTSDRYFSQMRVTIDFVCIGFRDGRMAYPTVRV